VIATAIVVLALVAGSILVVEQRRIADRDDRIAALTPSSPTSRARRRPRWIA
jgi:hypothetical protein